MMKKSKIKRAKTPAKTITITAERLSDNSRITFSIASDETIKHLRSILNRHLPPYSPNRFSLYSYQRGALIHFHPSSFKLDYFPVIFDQSVLLLKMDDRTKNYLNINNQIDIESESKQRRYSFFKYFKLSKFTTNCMEKEPLSSSSITCLSIFKKLFRQPSKSSPTTTDCRKNILLD